MKIVCEKDTLLNSINTVQKAVLTKSTLPVLEGILINADDILTLTGNNLELGIEITTEAEIIEKGQIVVNSKIFGDIIRKLPDNKVYITVNEDSVIEIKCENSIFNIKGLTAEEFPEIPIVEKNNVLSIEQNKLRSMIRQTSFAISTNENKIILTGSLINAQDNLLTMVSVDGYRLALRKENIDETDNRFSFVIPGKTLNELFKILKDTDEKVNIFVSEKHALIEFNSCKVVTRLLIGEFLDYKQIIPDESKLKVTADVNMLIDSIERASLIITSDNKKYPIVLSIKLDNINISCNTDMGNVSDTVKVQTFGDNIDIGFNNRYLLDALKACECEKIIMEMNDSLSPCVIKPHEGDNFIYLVLPVRLKQE